MNKSNRNPHNLQIGDYIELNNDRNLRGIVLGKLWGKHNGCEYSSEDNYYDAFWFDDLTTCHFDAKDSDIRVISRRKKTS